MTALAFVLGNFLFVFLNGELRSELNFDYDNLWKRRFLAYISNVELKHDTLLEFQILIKAF